MIRLTRLNGTPVVLNEDMIESVEELPDTTVLLFTGNKLIVRESARHILDQARDWARQCAGCARCGEASGRKRAGKRGLGARLKGN